MVKIIEISVDITNDEIQDEGIAKGSPSSKKEALATRRCGVSPSTLPRTTGRHHD